MMTLIGVSFAHIHLIDHYRLGSSGNTNVGGVEVLVPSGSISNLYMDENTMSAYVTLLSTMTVDLSATTGDLSLTSASALTFAANCASLDADIIAPSVTLQGVDGASIDLSIKGDVSGFIDGANLQILFEGNPTNVQMGGTNIQVGVSGGGSCSGVSMEGAVKSCSASTDVVTIDSNDCTSTSTILSVNCQTGQVSGGDGDGFDFSNGGNDFNENDDGNGDDNINENDNDNGNGNDDENDNDDRGFLGSTNPNDSGANARVLSFVAGVVLAFAAAGM